MYLQGYPNGGLLLTLSPSALAPLAAAAASHQLRKAGRR
jgi:hypothetical protein